MSAPSNNMVVVSPRAAKLQGNLTANNTPLQFGVNDLTPRQQLVISVGGSITTPTFALEASIDGGSTWFVITGTALTLTGQFTGDTAAIFATRYDVSGLVGAQFRFGTTAGSAFTNAAVTVLLS